MVVLGVTSATARDRVSTVIGIFTNVRVFHLALQHGPTAGPAPLGRLVFQTLHRIQQVVRTPVIRLWPSGGRGALSLITISSADATEEDRKIILILFSCPTLNPWYKLYC